MSTIKFHPTTATDEATKSGSSMLAVRDLTQLSLKGATSLDGGVTVLGASFNEILAVPESGGVAISGGQTSSGRQEAIEAGLEEENNPLPHTYPVARHLQSAQSFDVVPKSSNEAQEDFQPVCLLPPTSWTYKSRTRGMSRAVAQATINARNERLSTNSESDSPIPAYGSPSVTGGSPAIPPAPLAILSVAVSSDDLPGPDHDREWIRSTFAPAIFRELGGRLATINGIRLALKEIFEATLAIVAIVLYFTGHSNEDNAFILGDGQFVNEAMLFELIHELRPATEEPLPIIIALDFCRTRFVPWIVTPNLKNAPIPHLSAMLISRRGYPQDNRRNIDYPRPKSGSDRVPRRLLPAERPTGSASGPRLGASGEGPSSLSEPNNDRRRAEAKRRRTLTAPKRAGSLTQRLTAPPHTLCSSQTPPPSPSSPSPPSSLPPSPSPPPPPPPPYE